MGGASGHMPVSVDTACRHAWRRSRRAWRNRGDPRSGQPPAPNEQAFLASRPYLATAARPPVYDGRSGRIVTAPCCLLVLPPACTSYEQLGTDARGAVKRAANMSASDVQGPYAVPPANLGDELGGESQSQGALEAACAATTPVLFLDARLLCCASAGRAICVHGCLHQTIEGTGVAVAIAETCCGCIGCREVVAARAVEANPQTGPPPRAARHNAARPSMLRRSSRIADREQIAVDRQGADR